MLVTWLALAHASGASWSPRALPFLGVAVALVAWQPRLASLFARAASAPRTFTFVGLCAAAAAVVSWWVVQGPVANKPVSIDAGIYLNEARALAHGSLGMPLTGPGLAHASKFLFEGSDGHLYGVFPPGYPLALVPFVWLGAPMLAGPAVAAALVGAQYFLATSLAGEAPTEDEQLAARASLLFSLPSWSRAMETADLLSHAFVAVLAALALGAALRLRRGESPRLALLLGAAIGWAISARMLDGLVLALAAAAALLARSPRPSLRSLAIATAGALPFLALLLVHQHAATGSWTVPTQTEYFVRSDFPPTCHRLGFGADVGCTVEHPDSVAANGPDGYGLDDALRVTRERASSLGSDLFGVGPLLLLAFTALLLAPSGGDWLCVAFSLAFTIAYGLFYYGNSPLYGARHLFPVAPALYVVVARGLARLPHREGEGRLGRAHVRAGAMLAVLLAAMASERRQWRDLGAAVTAFQLNRSDLRRTAAKGDIRAGILKSPDPTAIAAAMDPWTDRDARKYVLDDRSGLLEMRRRHPDLPLLLSLANDEVGRLYVDGAPSPGITIEIERAWPSYQRPHGLGAKPSLASAYGVKDASGGGVMELHHASFGASLDVPFEIGKPGTYRLHLDGIAGPDQGDYDVTLDGEPLAPWRGYAPEHAKRSSAPSEPIALDLRRHVLTVRCAGRSEASTGYGALLDVLVGTPE
jgi:hypothetical protein